jgi:hypothetical protein
VSVDFNGNLQVFDSDSTNIGRIANLKVAGERAASTAKSAYTSCRDTIRTEILNWSETSGLAKAGF